MSKEAMKLALEALELNDEPLNNETIDLWERKTDQAITALREALAEQPAQQEYTSFAEWANDYVRANLHKLKPAQQEPPAWWPAVENILKEYGLQAIDFVADFKAALAEQPAQQEPVAWMKPHDKCDRACMYVCTKAFTQFPECATSPPTQRTWVGLTHAEITTSLPYSVTRDKGCFHAGALWADDKLKEKNNA